MVLIGPLEPARARLAKTFPVGPKWVYEPKWDGFRCLLFRHGDHVHLQSRSLKDLTRGFPSIESLLQSKPEMPSSLDQTFLDLRPGVLAAFDFLAPAFFDFRNLASFPSGNKHWRYINRAKPRTIWLRPNEQSLFVLMKRAILLCPALLRLGVRARASFLVLEKQQKIRLKNLEAHRPKLAESFLE
jgi:ATP dependent DNA ligase domain